MPNRDRLPRNAEAIVEAIRSGALPYGASFVVSFVGKTCLDMPHVYVQQARRYDWNFAVGLHANIVIGKGIDGSCVFGDLFAHTVLYPNFIDFDAQVLASLVDGAGGTLKLWPRRRGSEPWLALFG